MIVRPSSLLLCAAIVFATVACDEGAHVRTAGACSPGCDAGAGEDGDAGPSADDSLDGAGERAGDATASDGGTPPDDASLDGGFEGKIAIPECDLPGEQPEIVTYRRLQAELGAANGLWSLRCGLYASRRVLDAQLENVFSDACSAALPLGLRAGRIRFDAEAAERCIALQQDSNCLENLETTCSGLMVGGVEPGGDCYVNGFDECARGYFCDVGDSCPGRCRPRVAAGESAPGECVEDAYRDEFGVCAAVLDVGSACSADGPPCGGDTFCSGGGVCVTRPRRAPGERCAEEDHAICAGAAYCKDGTCTAIGKIGDACTRFECQIGLQCVQGKCAELSGEGEDCSFEVRCTYPLFCRAVGQEGSQGVCTARGSVGDACASRAECVPALYCPAGESSVCTAPVGDGESCAELAACQDGYYCAGVGEDALGHCTTLKGNGETCADSAECASFGCDGVCACNEPFVKEG